MPPIFTPIWNAISQYVPEPHGTIPPIEATRRRGETPVG